MKNKLHGIQHLHQTTHRRWNKNSRNTLLDGDIFDQTYGIFSLGNHCYWNIVLQHLSRYSNLLFEFVNWTTCRWFEDLRLVYDLKYQSVIHEIKRDFQWFLESKLKLETISFEFENFPWCYIQVPWCVEIVVVSFERLDMDVQVCRVDEWCWIANIHLFVKTYLYSS